MPEWLRDPTLERARVAHGFGLRTSPEPEGLRRPRQVHGTTVARLEGPDDELGDADAIVSRLPHRPIGVVTADCVPILLATRDGAAVAAVHAGWRGLAAGVVEAGVAALRKEGAAQGLVAAIGPSAGPCCYEVDDPVVSALVARYGELGDASRPSRPGHVHVDLARVVARALAHEGVVAGGAARACTICAPDRFHSFRRDGAGAGRLVHWIAARPV